MKIHIIKHLNTRHIYTVRQYAIALKVMWKLRLTEKANSLLPGYTHLGVSIVMMTSVARIGGFRDPHLSSFLQEK